MLKSVTLLSLLRRWKSADNARSGVPGEHWMTASAGWWLLSSARKRRSILGRVVVGGLGVALLARAAGGRGGLARVFSRRMR